MRLFLIFLFFALEAQAGVRLFAWKPFDRSAAFVIPVRDGETPEHAASEYFFALGRHDELEKLFEKHQPHSMRLVNFTELHESAFGQQAVLLANTGSDMNPEAKRIGTYSKTFGSEGLTTYILAMVADVTLNEKDAEDFRSRVANTFSLMVAMGGDDVDPSLYGKRNRYALSLTKMRDVSEMKMIQRYVSEERGFLFGTCRGLQLTSVALGYRLIQDIPTVIGRAVAHANDWHPVEFIKTTSNYLRQASNGLIHMKINSLHHQSVRFKAGGPLVVAARASDGVVEGLEFKNGRGLLVQFHPETMGDALGRRILKQVVRGVKIHVVRSCESSFL